MKNNSSINLLINPFHKIAGWNAFAIGIIVVIATIVIGQINGIVYDGVFDIHFANVPLSYAFCVQLCSLLILTTVLYAAGRIFSASKIRFIDMAGTTLTARTPFLLVSLIGFLPYYDRLNENLMNGIRTFDFFSINYGLLLPFVFISGIVLIWFILLAYSAFSVSCNLKGNKGIIVFLASLLIAEILSVLFNQFVLKKYLFASMLFLGTVNQTGIKSADYETINKISVEVTACFANKEYDKIPGYFNEKMKNALPVNQLEDVVKKLEEQFGAITFDSSQLKNSSISNSRLVFIPVKTDKLNLRLQLSFDEDDKISGMYFK